VFIGGELLYLNGQVKSQDEGKTKIHNTINSGEALEMFRRMIIGQGVREQDAKELCVDPSTVLPISTHKITLKAKSDGYVNEINARAFGEVSRDLGNGRKVPTDKVTHHAGLELKIKLGDCVKKGDALLVVYNNADELDKRMQQQLFEAFKIEPSRKKDIPESRVIAIIRE